MKSFAITSTVFALAVTASAAIRAAEADTPRTRAEVVAELKEARASGWLVAAVGEDSGSAWLSQHVVASQLTRAQVQAELRASRASGEYAALTNETGDEARPGPTKAEAVRYAGPDAGREAAPPASHG